MPATLAGLVIHATLVLRVLIIAIIMVDAQPIKLVNAGLVGLVNHVILLIQTALVVVIMEVIATMQLAPAHVFIHTSVQNANIYTAELVELI